MEIGNRESSCQCGTDLRDVFGNETLPANLDLTTTTGNQYIQSGRHSLEISKPSLAGLTISAGVYGLLSFPFQFSQSDNTPL